MHVEHGGFHQGVEGLGVLIPLWHKQRIHFAAQSGAVADVGQLAADQQGEAQVAVLQDGRCLPNPVWLQFQPSQAL
ncbi:hypothetical protein D3C71_2105710 [compost metagenome]